MTNVFQIEKKILTPADGNIHSDPVGLYDFSLIEFVPEHAVIEIRRILYHTGSELLPRKHPVFLDVSLLGKTFSRHTVKIRMSQSYFSIV